MLDVILKNLLGSVVFYSFSGCLEDNYLYMYKVLLESKNKAINKKQLRTKEKLQYLESDLSHKIPET